MTQSVSRSVAVVGSGHCSPLGPNLAVAGRLLGTASALQPIRWNPHIVHRDWNVGEIDPNFGDHSRAIHERMIVTPLAEALSQASLTAAELAAAGLFVGSNSGFAILEEQRIVSSKVNRNEALASWEQVGPNAVTEFVADHLDLGGPMITYSIACTSSAVALLQAFHAIAAGLIETAIVLGFDTLLNSTLVGFKSLLLHEFDTVRPFDRRRRGLRLSEGCGVLVLKAVADSHRHGVVRFLGGAQTTAPGGWTGSESDGSDVARTIFQALSQTGLSPKDIVAIKAHGTGTFDNDLSEGRGIFQVFGAEAPPIASLKGGIGHSLAASAVLEAALWLPCAVAGIVPKTVGFEEPDLELGIVPTRSAVDVPPGCHLLNSFGFGGSGVALIFEVTRQ